MRGNLHIRFQYRFDSIRLFFLSVEKSDGEVGETCRSSQKNPSNAHFPSKIMNIFKRSSFSAGSPLYIPPPASSLFHVRSDSSNEERVLLNFRNDHLGSPRSRVHFGSGGCKQTFPIGDEVTFEIRCVGFEQSAMTGTFFLSKSVELDIWFMRSWNEVMSFSFLLRMLQRKQRTRTC